MKFNLLLIALELDIDLLKLCLLCQENFIEN